MSSKALERMERSVKAVEFILIYFSFCSPSSVGVYFDSCVRHIKFVDFCGKYRLPLMHYLCSPECTSPCSSNPQSDADSDDDQTIPADRLQRVLLG